MVNQKPQKAWVVTITPNDAEKGPMQIVAVISARKKISFVCEYLEKIYPSLTNKDGEQTPKAKTDHGYIAHISSGDFVLKAQLSEVIRTWTEGRVSWVKWKGVDFAGGSGIEKQPVLQAQEMKNGAF